jgi:hypothetical protein
MPDGHEEHVRRHEAIMEGLARMMRPEDNGREA